MADTYESVGFYDVAIGDRIRFITSDNGYGGQGQVWREGEVTHVTLSTVKVACDSNLLGLTATLRRSAWSDRAVSRTN